MTRSNWRRRLSLGALLATAAIGSAAPAQAHPPTPAECEARLVQLEERFRQVEERRGYEAATEWWEVHWAQYHKRCVLPYV